MTLDTGNRAMIGSLGGLFAGMMLRSIGWSRYLRTLCS